MLRLLVLTFLLSFGKLYAQSTDTSSIKILSFKTHILRKDSVWNTTKKIEIPTVPGLLSIQFADISDSLEPNFICVLTEPLSLKDTLRLGKQSSLHFNHLAGGIYTLNFINLKNGNSKTLEFSIAFELWKKWWFVPLFFIAIMTLFGLFFFFVYLIKTREQARQTKLKYQLEIKALKAQMNPHFIFNSMNTIDAYILNKRFIEASDFLQKFSKLIRRILNNSDFTTVSLANEIETLKIYIELEQERFSDTFSYSIFIDPKITLDAIQIPPLLIQPFIENSILHGIRHLKEKMGHLIIEFNLNDKRIDISITDNGIGRERANKINIERHNSHMSLGTKITLDRILYYQALFGYQQQPEIIDLKNGTQVNISIPVNIIQQTI